MYKGLCNNYQEGGGGGEKREGVALPKIATKIGGAQSKITHLTEGGHRLDCQTIDTET